MIISSSNYGDTTWLGLTYGSTTIGTPARIYFNTYGKFYAGGDRRIGYENSKHELGHELGLNHDWGTHAIMYPQADGHHLRITRFERHELRELYRGRNNT